MKKKQFLACLLVLAMALGLFAGCSKTVETPTTAAPTAEPTTTEAPTPSQDAADLVLTGGTIQTMVGEETAEAVAVKDGIIVYVGDSEGAKAYIADSTQVIDLEGKFVSPGFIDGHTHDVQNLIIQGGIVYLNETDPDIELYKAALQAFVDEHPDATMIHGSGINLNAFPDSLPTNDWIDEICPDIPVYFSTVDLHGALLNTKALEICEITVDTEPVMNGNILKDANGELTGYLSDCGSMLGNLPEQERTPEMFWDAFLIYQAEANSYGITGINMGGTEMDAMVEWQTIDEMQKANELNLRINTPTWAGKPFNQEEAQRLVAVLDEAQKFNSDFLNITMVKASMDGVPEAKTSALLEPYAPEAGEAPDYCGPEVTAQEDLNDFVATLNGAGYQVQVHAMGDASVRTAVNAYEYSIQQNGEGDYRNIITHLNLVTEEDAQRMGQMGIYAAMQPIWWFYDPMFSPLELQMLGPERYETVYHIRDLVDYGITITGSVDYPVTLDYAPLLGIETGVTMCAPYPGLEDDESFLRDADQAVTAMEMLQMYTINAAKQMRMEDKIGTIEVGKKADLVVLAENILTCEAKHISDVAVVYTISDGRIVYENP